jgi:hypothetical protein
LRTIHQAIEVAVEAEIGEFVRRDGARLRRTPETDSELVANSAVMLVQRMGGTSVREIDRLIAELQTLRALLQEEGERAQRKCQRRNKNVSACRGKNASRA